MVLHIHTEAAEAIAIIRWIVDAIGVKTHGLDAVVSEEKVRGVLGKMGMTSLLTRARSACRGNFSEKYLDFHYTKESRYGRNQDILMVRVLDDFFKKNPLGISFDFPLPSDVSGEDMYLQMIDDGFLPQGYREVREYIREEEVATTTQAQSSSSWDSILLERRTSKKKKRGRRAKATSFEQTPAAEPASRSSHGSGMEADEDLVLNLILQTETGGMPHGILEERSGLNGELEEAIDVLLDSGSIRLVAGQTHDEDIYVGTKYFEDD